MSTSPVDEAVDKPVGNVVRTAHMLWMRWGLTPEELPIFPIRPARTLSQPCGQKVVTRVDG